MIRSRWRRAAKGTERPNWREVRRNCFNSRGGVIEEMMDEYRGRLREELRAILVGEKFGETALTHINGQLSGVLQIAWNPHSRAISLTCWRIRRNRGLIGGEGWI